MHIRRYRPPTETFVEEFQATIIPSAIPSAQFIDWERIRDSIDAYAEQFRTIQHLQGVSEQAFIDGLADIFVTTETPRVWVDFCFELLGERNNKYSAYEGVWRFNDLKQAFLADDRDTAREVATILQEMGLQHVVDTASLYDHYRGMLVGMETHKRKNRQGTAFEGLVESLLTETAAALPATLGEPQLAAEYKTEYDDLSGQNKVVDFALFLDGQLRLVVEANAYKGGGSKPSEIRRSYNYVAQRMRADGVGFVWITDGQGWARSLTNVLRQSYDDIVDLYNLHQAEAQLTDDVVAFLTTTG